MRYLYRVMRIVLEAINRLKSVEKVAEECKLQSTDRCEVTFDPKFSKKNVQRVCDERNDGV